MKTTSVVFALASAFFFGEAMGAARLQHRKQEAWSQLVNCAHKCQDANKVIDARVVSKDYTTCACRVIGNMPSPSPSPSNDDKESSEDDSSRSKKEENDNTSSASEDQSQGKSSASKDKEDESSASKDNQDTSSGSNDEDPSMQEN